MTQLPLARKPYARLQDNGINESTLREFAKIERQQGGMFVPRVLAFGMNATAYVVRGTDWLILCNCTGGAITLSFPSAGTMDGLYVMVIKTDASANAVTLSGTFNGVVNPTLTKQYQSKTINAGNGSYYFVPTLTAADILSGTFPGNYVIAGTLEVDGNFSVNTSKFTVTASNGNTAVAGTLSVTSDFAVNTNKFTVTASSGNTTIAGTLGVTGSTTLAAVTTTDVTVAKNASSATVTINPTAGGASDTAQVVFSRNGNPKWIIGNNTTTGSDTYSIAVAGVGSALDISLSTRAATFAANINLPASAYLVGSGAKMIGLDANGIIQLGDTAGATLCALPRYTGLTANANYKGILYADTGTAGQLVFMDGATGARYKLTGTAF